MCIIANDTFALRHRLTVLLPHLELEEGAEVALLAAAAASIGCKFPDSRTHAQSQPLESTDA